MPTPEFTNERIRNLENEVQRLAQALEILRSSGSDSAHFESVRIIDTDDRSIVNNPQFRPVHFASFDPQNQLVKRQTTSQPGHRLWRFSDHPWLKSKRRYRVCFFYDGRWIEFPQFAAAGVFRAMTPIPARSSTSPGMAIGHRYRLENGILVQAVEEPPYQLHNLARSEVDNADFLQAKMDTEGNWWVDFEDCSSGGTGTGGGTGGTGGTGGSGSGGAGGGGAIP